MIRKRAARNLVLAAAAALVLTGAALPRSATTFSSAAQSPLPSVEAGVPSALILSDGRIRVYFCSGREGMRSATSGDGGATFVLDAGSRIFGACDGSFIELRSGGYRFLTSESTSPTFGRAQLISYLTPDGLTFTREQGVRFTGSPADNGFTGVPQAVELPDGRHRLYYVGDPLNGTPAGNGVRTAISNDEGLTWAPEMTTNLLPRSHVDPEVRPLTGGGYRMFVRVPGAPGGAVPGGIAGIWWADSADGLSFTLIGRAIRDPEDIRDAADPAILALADGRVLMFLGSREGRLRVAIAQGAVRRRAVSR